MAGPYHFPLSNDERRRRALRDLMMRQAGNIDLGLMAPVNNPDGSVSTVRSIGIEENGRHVLIPTVVNGKVVDDRSAIDHYRKTGKHLGVFPSRKESDEYAQKLHQKEELRTSALAALIRPPKPSATSF